MKPITRHLALVLLLVSALPVQAANPSELFCLASMVVLSDQNPDHRLKRTLERARSAAERREKLAETGELLKEQAQLLRDSMGFRDRFLGGRFGGNRARSLRVQLMVENAHRATALSARTAEKLQRRQAELERELDALFAEGALRLFDGTHGRIASEVMAFVESNSEALRPLVEYQRSLNRLRAAEGGIDPGYGYLDFGYYEEVAAKEEVLQRLPLARAAMKKWNLKLDQLVAKLEGEESELPRLWAQYLKVKKASLDVELPTGGWGVETVRNMRRRLAVVRERFSS